MQKIEMSQKRQIGFVQSIANGFKRSMQNFIDYNLAYRIVGQVRQTFQKLITSAKELDSVMVNLQIASGASRSDIRGMMIDFNSLAKELGRST